MDTSYKKSEIFWLIDMSFTKMKFGPYGQQDYHYYMLEKWGSRYSKYYVKHITFNSDRGNYNEL